MPLNHSILQDYRSDLKAGSLLCQSPLGQLSIEAVPTGITAVTLLQTALAPQYQRATLSELPHQRAQTKEFHILDSISADPVTLELLNEAAAQLKQYFLTHRQDFDLPLAATGTLFQQQVWQQLCKIRYGTTCSYADIANALANPKAVRAVGAANGRNPIAIIVPCHRVIGRQGQLTGYAGGLAHKVWLLQHEQT